jgi:glucose/arabinose dehydrogenase
VTARGTDLRRLWIWASALFVAFTVAAVSPGPARAALPQGFTVSTVFSGLAQPTAVAFSPDGRVFVAEMSGIIKVFDNISDTAPDVFADLRTNVHEVGERGLLGMAVNPNFPSDPYVHVVYSYDADIGGQPPKWNDTCGPDGENCLASARLSRLQAEGNRAVAEQVLIEDWCSTTKFHSVGDLAFGPGGALYVSAGDGSHLMNYGQLDEPANPCGDPPVGVGQEQQPPAAEGGALRAQDLRTPGDPVTLDGTVIRVDPATGAALPDNPLAKDPDPNARRVIAYGLRNPYRFTVRPGTNELWVADVGSSDFEELNRIPASRPGGGVPNFGWPCYEGPVPQAKMQAFNLTMCLELYNQADAVTPPVFPFRLAQEEGCGAAAPAAVGTPTRTGPGTQALSGVAFYQGGAYPDSYDGALFLGDYARQCLWVLRPGANGELDPSTLETVGSELGAIVDLKVGPDGDLFYVHIGDPGSWREGTTGEVRRISYAGG